MLTMIGQVTPKTTRCCRNSHVERFTTKVDSSPYLHRLDCGMMGESVDDENRVRDEACQEGERTPSRDDASVDGKPSLS
jgi:hypothetical protein